jgi:hypothetical protein
MNSIFLFFIFASFLFYFYFKTKQFRTPQRFPIRKKMFSSLSGSSLGGLLIFFGLNQIVLFDGVITYIIAAVFILFGLFVFVFNFRAFKHYKQFVEEETELNEIKS